MCGSHAPPFKPAPPSSFSRCLFQDDTAITGQVFSCGLTLEEVSAYTVDSSGNRAFVTSDALDHLRKVCCPHPSPGESPLAGSRDGIHMTSFLCCGRRFAER